LQNNLLSAILIEDVDKELMRYPPEMAWDLLIQTQSNPLISMQPAWREHYPALFEKYRARLFEYHEEQKDLTAAIKKTAERPTYGAYYASGATHDDHRKQLSIGETAENVAKLKCLSNE
jgi:hypothetical protein